MEVDNALEWRGRDLFLKKEFALSVVGGRHGCFCTHKRGDFGAPGTRWASQPVRMTRYRSMCHSTPQRSWSTQIEMMRKRHGETRAARTRLTVVIKYFVHYSKNLESSYSAFFDEARIPDICSDFLFSGFLQGAAEAICRRDFRVLRLVCRYPDAL